MKTNSIDKKAYFTQAILSVFFSLSTITASLFLYFKEILPDIGYYSIVTTLASLGLIVISRRGTKFRYYLSGFIGLVLMAPIMVHVIAANPEGSSPTWVMFIGITIAATICLFDSSTEKKLPVRNSFATAALLAISFFL